MSLQEWFKSLKKWVDGEDDLDDGGQPKPRSKWEDFLVAIARQVETTMQEEMFTPPGGPTYIPREYIVFLSTADDADWQGEKREGLQRGLYHVLSERARELVGDKDFQTKTFTVELRVDGALEKGHFRVQHLWDNNSDKTMVTPRKPAPVTEPSPMSFDKLAGQKLADQNLADQKEEDATIVRPRSPKEKVFSVAVVRNVAGAESAAPDSYPFYKNEITIGRGSKQVAVDLRLEGDLEVSRNHAILKRRDDGTYSVTCQGANAIILDGGREVPAGETADVKPGEKIGICSYELRITDERPVDDKPAEKPPVEESPLEEQRADSTDERPAEQQAAASTVENPAEVQKADS
jgi:hypothetical protein